VRRCIGASFAQVEMREVLRRVRLRAPSRRPEGVRAEHVTAVPARGCRVVVEAGTAPAARARPAAVASDG
jgi:cytochrome P450 family 135